MPFVFHLSLIFISFSFSSQLTHARTSPILSPVPSPLSSPQMHAVFPISLTPVEPPLDAATQMRVDRPRQLNRDSLIAEIIVPVVVGSVILLSLCAWICRRRKLQDSDLKGARVSNAGRGLSLGLIMGKFRSFKSTEASKGTVAVIEYTVLESATNNFSSSNVLGEGGFGHVFKAHFNDNHLAAVKKIEGTGHDCEREFENEINLLSRFEHPNIVSLSGYSIHGQTRLIVYELMQNGSLETQLHGPSHGLALSWHLRMKIALDVARGLEYLHEHCNPPVIHRDLKSSNILLDSNFNAKIADFGLAIIVGAQNRNNLKLSGTLGYVAPEYLLDGKLTEKSDVYAFGVVLLELLIGRKPIEIMAPAQCQSIVTWAMPQLTDRSKLPNIIDPSIQNKMDLKHLYQVAAITVLCIQPEPSYRPLITDVLHSLIPLVPVELGGTMRVIEPISLASHTSLGH